MPTLSQSISGISKSLAERLPVVGHAADELGRLRHCSPQRCGADEPFQKSTQLDECERLLKSRNGFVPRFNDVSVAGHERERNASLDQTVGNFRVGAPVKIDVKKNGIKVASRQQSLMCRSRIVGDAGNAISKVPAHFLNEEGDQKFVFDNQNPGRVAAARRSGLRAGPKGFWTRRIAGFLSNHRRVFLRWLQHVFTYPAP